MDLGVTNASPSSKATCLDLMLGSLTVSVNDGGVCKVAESTTITGGLITGPGGTPSVTCEDRIISVMGDAITAHGPCPAPPDHCAAVTTGSADVLIGQGITPGGGQPGLLGADITVPQFNITYPANPTNINPSTGWSLGVDFSYNILNEGDSPTGPFTIGLYEVLGLPPTIPPPADLLPPFITISRNNLPPFLVEIDVKTVPSLVPGGGFSDTWHRNPGDGHTFIPPGQHARYYVMGTDIDLEVFERMDANNSSGIAILATS